MDRKKQLIQDIENLLNNHGEIQNSTINPQLLEFMDEETLLSIIDSMLSQKDNIVEDNIEWLEKFKDKA